MDFSCYFLNANGFIKALHKKKIKIPSFGIHIWPQSPFLVSTCATSIPITLTQRISHNLSTALYFCTFESLCLKYMFLPFYLSYFYSIVMIQQQQQFSRKFFPGSQGQMLPKQRLYLFY